MSTPAGLEHGAEQTQANDWNGPDDPVGAQCYTRTV